MAEGNPEQVSGARVVAGAAGEVEWTLSVLRCEWELSIDPELLFGNHALGLQMAE